MNDQPLATLRAYVEAFESLDPERVAAFYHLPCMFIAPIGVTAIADAEGARGVASALIEHARGQGYRRTAIGRSESRMLADNLASLSGVFVRFGSGDEEIGRFGFAYTMFDDGTGWRIVVATAHGVAAEAGA